MEASTLCMVVPRATPQVEVPHVLQSRLCRHNQSLDGASKAAFCRSLVQCAHLVITTMLAILLQALSRRPTLSDLLQAP